MKPYVLISAVFLVSMFSCYKPIQKPDDFDKFWQSSLNDIGSEVVHSVIIDTIIGDKKLTLNAIKSYNEVTIHSWVSTPNKTGKFPVFVSFFGFGKGSKDRNTPPNKWFLKQENAINILVDIRGQGLSTDQIKSENYITNGLDSNENYIYKGAFLDAVKTIDFAKNHSQGDGNVVVMGGGHGGALAIAATALNPKVTMCVARFPFLTDISNYDKTKWPMKIWIHETKIKERKLEDLHKTLSYFDVLNFSERINVPFFLKTQETDTITPKEGAIKLFNAIKHTNKELFVAPCVGHGCSSKSEQGKKLEYEFIKANMKSN